MLLNNRDFISGLALTALAAALYYQTLGGGIILFEDDIDPMIYPRVISVMLGILGIIICIRGLIKKNVRPDSIPVFTRRTVGISLVLLAYAGIFNYVGFAISSFCAGCAIAMIMGWRKVVPLALANVVIVGCIWILFVKGLKIQLPAGLLF